MASKLSLLPQLQRWDGSQLTLNLLVLPRVSPLDPLDGGSGPPFATADFTFDIRLVSGLDAMPVTTTPATSITKTPGVPAHAQSLFNELTTVFEIDPAPTGGGRRADTRVKKHAPLTYVAAAGFDGSRTTQVVNDDSYSCAFQALPTHPFTVRNPPNPKTAWGAVLAFALRQPVLAEALGLLRRLVVSPPTTDFFADGGWVFVALAAGGDAGLLALPGALSLYAARVPPLHDPRPVFNAVLFPVADTVPPGPYDDVIAEAIDYDDGFAKVVHCTQPRASNPLFEEDDGTRPVNELGIRLGWDDEQVTIWLDRQLNDDPVIAALDAPLGVLGYRIDARDGDADPHRALDPAHPWHGLSRAGGPVRVGALEVATFDGELAVETHPVQLEMQKTGTFWLPMYFASWAGPALVGVDILGHQLVGGADKTDPSRVQAIDPNFPLRYGRTYQFRVRLMDHSGGGPGITDSPATPAPAPVAIQPCRRFVRPLRVRLTSPPPDVPDPLNPPATLTVARPRLSYPAYVLTGAPNAAADLLADLPSAKAEQREVGLPDPDVTQLEIQVQVRALGLDTEPGGGTDHGFHSVYTTTRAFPSAADQPLVLALQWVDVADVDTLAPGAASGAISVPTARDVRLVLSALCREDPTLEYFGAQDVRRGPSISVSVRKHSIDERGLLLPGAPAEQLRAVYLQPDQPNDPVIAAAQKAAGKGVEATGAVAERLAAALDLQLDGLTMHARPGRRLLFGCSPAIRHVIGPDGSTLTFAAKSDLLGHWLVALRVTLGRDWTWDGLAPGGITIARERLTQRRCADGVEVPFGTTGPVGEIEAVRTAGVDALAEPDRSHTDLIFIDAIEPKPEPGAFPGELTAGYRLEPQFVHAPSQHDPALELTVDLPVTTPPSQVPRLVSAGVALSPYERSESYDRTTSRQRALWFEFDRAPENPCDAYYVRVLGYAPDPVLMRSVDQPEAAEPPLPIDPELVRVIVPGQSDDRAGAGAMQHLVASDSPLHFLVPLPPGTHADSPELFGFFTYELRVGHDRGWSTAQGRFGAPLRVTGVQHPAPELSCLVTRDGNGIVASAPFATPVLDGVSRRPYFPATQLWILLYAQVVQSDGKDRRNVLLDQRRATADDRWGREQLSALTRYSTFAPIIWSGPDFGTATWSDDVIKRMLAELTLGNENPLSCLAVETLPADDPQRDPLHADLGFERILRTSPLVPCPSVC
jgi:hypothetical protein